VCAHEVVNPDHVELVELLADVRNYQGLNEDLLRTPAQLMGTGGAWTGAHAATVFTEEIEGRHTNLPRRFDALVDSIEHRLSRVPATLPPEK